MTPHEIAAKLSEAQRKKILGLTRYCAWATQYKLQQLGLVVLSAGVLELTPLGLEVREILKEQV